MTPSNSTCSRITNPTWRSTTDGEYFRTSQPRTLILWGKNDRSFTVEEAKVYQLDLPRAELNLLDTGHFAKKRGNFIAERIKAFLTE
jgi:hypothetical protein